MTDITKLEVETTVAAKPEPAGKQLGSLRMAREPQPIETTSPAKTDAKTSAASGPQSRGPSKIASVIVLLQRPEGATLAEMVEATSWLPHTTRAALTGLKKKDRVITKSQRDGLTCYHIAKAV